MHQADREADRGREMERKMMGRRRLRGIRVARVKLETYPFNMSYLSILSVRGAREGGATPAVQRPNSIQRWDRGQLPTSHRNCNGWWEMEVWRETPFPHTCKPSTGQFGKRRKERHSMDTCVYPPHTTPSSSEERRREANMSASQIPVKMIFHFTHHCNGR